MNKYQRVIYITESEKDAGYLMIDVYFVLKTFCVVSHPVAHAIKKLIRVGSGDKSERQDIQEAIDSLTIHLQQLERVEQIIKG